MTYYHLEPFGPDQVKVHEHECSYPMTKAQAQENLAYVRAHRAYYASDESWLRQVNFYEDILAAMPGGGAV
jgi:hypothetical protein